MLPSIENLRCFLAAARACSFRAGSREVALTPTAFSQRIRQLEELLGQKLFERTTRVCTLTPAGLALVPIAERCLAAAAECSRIGRGDVRSPPMDIVVGTRHELGLSWLLPQRHRLMKAHPSVTIHFYFGASPDLHLRVRSHEIDCAITSSLVSDPRLDTVSLHVEEYVFVGAPSLLDRVPLRKVEDIATHTLVDVTSDLRLFKYFRDAVPGGEAVRPREGIWMGTIAAIRQLVLDGDGVAVLPAYFVNADLAAERLRVLLPKIRPKSDQFRLVFRTSDPRRGLFESLAGDMRRAPLC